MTSLQDLMIRAQQGDPEAQYQLALKYDKGDETPQDLRAAFNFYLQAARQNHPSAQAALGDMFRRGE